MEKLLRYLGDADKTECGEILARFEYYYSLLVKWNKKFNLTRIVDRGEVIVKHFADSLEGLRYADGRICDLGSGAGFPGIPFSIADKSKQIILIDSVLKKVTFLREVIDTFSLPIKAEHIRAEDAAHSVYREYFDTVAARAVAPLPTLLEYALPLLKTGGRAIIYKGESGEKELELSKNALGLLKGEIQDIKKYNLLDTDNKRTLIIIKKSGTCPANYPRYGNKPRIMPL